MKRIDVEMMSRVVPYSQYEFTWAMSRPPASRTPIPAVNDSVMFRLDEWTDPWPATVLQVQPLDDVDDPHLWRVEMDPLGVPVLLEGRPLMKQGVDPWPIVWCRIEAAHGKIVHSH